MCDLHHCWLNKLQHRQKLQNYTHKFWNLWRVFCFAPHKLNFGEFMNFSFTHCVNEDEKSLNQQTKMNCATSTSRSESMKNQTCLKLTWTAQLRKQLFWPGPLRRPLVSVSWCCWFDCEVKMFIGKFRVIGDLLDAAMCGWKFVPTVILWFSSELSRRYRCWPFIDFYEWRLSSSVKKRWKNLMWVTSLSVGFGKCKSKSMKRRQTTEQFNHLRLWHLQSMAKQKSPQEWIDKR